MILNVIRPEDLCSAMGANHILRPDRADEAMVRVAVGRVRLAAVGADTGLGSSGAVAIMGGVLGRGEPAKAVLALGFLLPARAYMGVIHRKVEEIFSAVGTGLSRTALTVVVVVLGALGEYYLTDRALLGAAGGVIHNRRAAVIIIVKAGVIPVFAGGTLDAAVR